MQWKKGLIALLVVTGVVFVLWRALRPVPVDVDTALVSRQTLVSAVEGEGRTRVLDRYVISAPVAGRVERIRVVEGDRVAAGDVIALLTPVPLDQSTALQLRAQLTAAEGAIAEVDTLLAQARFIREQSARDLTRLRALDSLGGVSRQQLEQAELAWRARTADIATLEERRRIAVAEGDRVRAALLGAGAGQAGVASPPGLPALTPLRLTAPVTATVLRIADRNARVVAPGTPLAELGDPASLQVVVDVLSTDAVRIVPGAAVRLDGWGGDSVLHAVVDYVEPAATTRLSALGVEEQRVNVVATLTTPVAALGDGFRLDAAIEIWRGENVLALPVSALFRTSDGWGVFAVRDGRAVLTPITPGYRSSTAVQVLDGVAEGDEVILFPSDLISDGVAVRSRQARGRGDAR